jgi:hypothetical protein
MFLWVLAVRARLRMWVLAVRARLCAARTRR